MSSYCMRAVSLSLGSRGTDSKGETQDMVTKGNQPHQASASQDLKNTSDDINTISGSGLGYL